MFDLHLGDCIKAMSTFEPNSVDMVLADLPFGTTRQEWDQVLDLQKLWKQYQRIVKDNGAIVLFAKPPFDKILAHSNIDNYRYDWVWEKTRATGHLNARRMPMQAHENVCVFYAKQPLYIPQMSTGHKPMNNYYSSHLGECYGKSSVMAGGGSTERFPRSVLKYPPVPNKDRLHPNQKPVALLEFFIKTYTKEGDVVLDNTMGSGSTGEACMNLKRRFVGVEKEPKYFNPAQARLSALQAA